MTTRDTRLTRKDASAPQAPVQEGELFAGKYVIGRVIGAGAMGVVVAANHAQLGERVVLKFLRAEMAQRPEVVSRFLREARSAVRVRSEHVARIFDVGTTANGLPYIVMEHLDGCDLQQLLRARGALPLADAVEYVAQTCLAMTEAHGAGIVHRDLKPSNLFLTRRGDGSSLIKVLDFGISKVIADAGDQTDLTSTNGMLGSPAYVSPEQARSARSVDARADVWSLGVILHHLLTGQPPFGGDSFTEVLAAILYSPPKPLTDALPEAPPELEAILFRCLAKDIERRMPNMVELALALVPWAQPDTSATISRVAGQCSCAGDPLVRATRAATAAPPPPSSIDLDVDVEFDLEDTTMNAERTAGAPAVGRRRLPKLRELTVVLVLGGIIGTAFVASYRARFIPPVPPSVAVVREPPTTIPNRVRPEPSVARLAAALASVPPGGASPPEVTRPAPRSTPPRTPAATWSMKDGTGTSTRALIDPGSLTFDLRTAPSAGHPPP